MAFSGEPSRETARPLAGARGWVICDGRAGMISQTRGVAEALGLDVEMKIIAPSGIYKLLAPWGPADPALRIGQPGSAFAPPWPTVVIATGRASIPPLTPSSVHRNINHRMNRTRLPYSTP